MCSGYPARQGAAGQPARSSATGLRMTTTIEGRDGSRSASTPEASAWSPPVLSCAAPPASALRSHNLEGQLSTPGQRFGTIEDRAIYHSMQPRRPWRQTAPQQRLDPIGYTAHGFSSASTTRSQLRAACRPTNDSKSRWCRVPLAWGFSFLWRPASRCVLSIALVAA